jgi:hypothetical protein
MTVVVIPPAIQVVMSRGNVGRDMLAVRHTVAAKLLEIVRQWEPSARLFDAAPISSGPIAPPVSRSPMASGAIAPEESHAMVWAFEQGATHLLVPTITEWRQMRTDDPIGAVASGHNRVTVLLRLIPVQQPRRPACEVVFTNRARLTLNQHVERLLDGHFRATVRQLLSCRGGSVPGRSSSEP